MLTCCSRIVFVHDPTDSDPYVIPIGKQTLRQSHIFYRPCSGIWQSVWMESVPANHITSLDVNGDANGNGMISMILYLHSLTSISESDHCCVSEQQFPGTNNSNREEDDKRCGDL